MVRQLLEQLNRELLVLDWRQKQASRAAVQVAIETALDAGLPDAYGPDEFGVKAHMVYQHVFEQYWGDGRSVYGDVT